MPLSRAFYRRRPAVVARALLGCVLVSRRGRAETAGRIVETEAYLGPEDGASHAAFRPGSHALFYGDGGHAYVFVAYGVHLCLNRSGCRHRAACWSGRSAVRGPRYDPPARARPGAGSPQTEISRAPSASAGQRLFSRRLTIEPPDQPRAFRICTGARIGITRAVERPLRFWVAGNRFVSGQKA